MTAFRSSLKVGEFQGLARGMESRSLALAGQLGH